MTISTSRSQLRDAVLRTSIEFESVYFSVNMGRLLEQPGLVTDDELAAVKDIRLKLVELHETLNKPKPRRKHA